ncbi:hypothetical protein SSP531S_56950 [Streptomyces spongiicola]|uniref:Uncharacterized protein n=1 Tax=Streptomyces spongiicola TaxID=1690221 RepID=A0A388T5H5_9ACTN|nr:hypothetical protein [Streptomyces spongiicola]GBQ04203.1 hypothetical protein SSP531S_56950 [Streptomyces spongiicola]
MSGSPWLKDPGTDVRDALPPAAERNRSGRAGADPVGELAGRLDDFVAAAVHPDEVAALLESDGLTDEQIRRRYGHDDSFALAEDLYARVERRFPRTGDPPPGPGSPALLGCLLRGLLFTLPGLGHVLAAPVLAGGGTAHAPLLAAALAGWAWNQALAHRAYTWLGLGDRPAAARALLRGAPVGVVLGTAAAAAVAPAAPDHGPALLFAAGQSLYLAAATVLLVLGRERVLLAALLPLVGGALYTALQPMPGWAHPVLPLASVTAATGLAAGAVAGMLRPAGHGGRSRSRGRSRGRSRSRSRNGRGRAAPSGLGGSVPYGLFGLGSGVLVLHVALDNPPFAVALTLGMGPAEWLLHRFRADSLAGLRACTSPGAFRIAVGSALLRSLAGYLAVLPALMAASLLLWPGGADRPAPAAAAGALLLGAVLWTGLLLQAFGAVLSPAAVCCLAALVPLLLPGSGPLLAPAAASGVLVLLVCAQLGRITAHR